MSMWEEGSEIPSSETKIVIQVDSEERWVKWAVGQLSLIISNLATSDNMGANRELATLLRSCTSQGVKAGEGLMEELSCLIGLMASEDFDSAFTSVQELFVLMKDRLGPENREAAGGKSGKQGQKRNPAVRGGDTLTKKKRGEDKGGGNLPGKGSQPIRRPRKVQHRGQPVFFPISL